MAGKNSKLDKSALVFVEPLKDGYKCTMCNLDLVWRSPLQTNCGHRLCKTCVNVILTSDLKICPEDNTVLSTEQIFPDKACEREMEELDIFCSNKDQGCHWIGRLKFLKNHQSECLKQPLACPKGCQEIVLRSEMGNHFANDCPLAHTNCPMADQCDFQGSRTELREHLAQKNIEHVSMVEEKIGAMQSGIETIQISTTTMQHRQEDLEDRFANQREELVTLRDGLATLHAAVDRYAMADVEEEAQPLRSGDPEGAQALEDLKERLRKLEEQVARICVRERQRHADQGRANEAVADLERRVIAMEHQNELRDVNIADHDAKLHMLETTSYDGTFVWKIDDYARLFNEAIMGKRLAIDSPPFFVGRNGYKVCARAFANGDCLGKGTHLSLFLVVMRGEYDALLPWPFRQKVTFKLMDQSQDQHILYSFQRPVNRNIASGCPLFAPRDVVNGKYIKDNVMFVKITVDTTGIPTF